MVPAPAHILQELFHCSSHIWANVVVLQPIVVSISASLVWKAEFSRMSSYMKALTFPSGATNDVVTPLCIPTNTTTEPPSHRTGS